jgi:hypothetical protein
MPAFQVIIRAEYTAHPSDVGAEYALERRLEEAIENDLLKLPGVELSFWQVDVKEAE